MTGSAPVPQRGLHVFAVLTAAATVVLICFGGLVTSHGAGLAVPDWPNTYGYNLFLFPISLWAGGIFYEHTHRLVAAGVGLLTTGLALWLWWKEPRRWVRWLGVAAWVGVVLQGVLGGLRVVLLQDELGIIHATLAQLFLLLVAIVALVTSRWWRESRWWQTGTVDRAGLRGVLLATTVLVLLQLLLGGAMRHRHAGLAIPDFPAAYGRVWPTTDPVSIARYNQQREEVRAVNPIAPTDIHLHMAHRLTGLLILGAVTSCAVTARRSLARRHPVSRLAAAWWWLILLQVGLGAATVWSGKAADVATAHVAVGSLGLTLGGILTLIAFRSLTAPSRVASRAGLARTSEDAAEGRAATLTTA